MNFRLKDTSGRPRKYVRTERCDWWMPGKDAGADVGTAGEARGERCTSLRGQPDDAGAAD
jgi:hypothetical protein